MNKNIKNPLVIFLMGTTASGKTKLVLQLSKLFPLDIISVDSALIYRNMNIGTDKPNSEILIKYPHRLIDIRDPVDIYTAENFRLDALKEIERSIFINKRIPILVGGTMLYYKVLLHGLSKLPKSNHKLDLFAQNNLDKKNSNLLYAYLKEIDYSAASKIHFNDIRRIIRAIEVFLISKKKITNLHTSIPYFFPYNVLQFFLFPFNRITLHKNIEYRFNKMLEMGFQNEVENLFSRSDLHSDLPSIRCIGYRQMWKYLSNKINYKEMIYRTVCSTRQLAKKQITWSKKWKNLCILNSNDLNISMNTIVNKIKNFYMKK